MSSSCEHIVLNALLDIYERSDAFASARPPKRRVILALYAPGRAGTRRFELYDIEDSEQRTRVNRAVLRLASCGLVGFEWMRGERDHIISRVWLNYERLEDAYTTVDRQPKAQAAQAFADQVAHAAAHARDPWAQTLFAETMASLAARRTPGRLLPSDFDEAATVILAVDWIQTHDFEELYERVFSLQALGDSKRFEREARAWLLRILRLVSKGACEEGGEVSDDELLRRVGIVRYPERFDLSGDVNITLGGVHVALGVFVPGASLTSVDVRTGNLTVASHVSRMLTIENKANYYDYLQQNRTDDELVVFHGGQLSPARRGFILELYQALPRGCELLHWGDIDYGGFVMLDRLRTELGMAVKPYRMGILELEGAEGAATTATFDDAYAARLSLLLERVSLVDCHSTIRHMLKHRVRLEQEALI
jgi:hypothetical protein